MNQRELFEQIGAIDDDIILNAKIPVNRQKKTFILPAAACMAIFLAIGGYFMINKTNQIELPLSTGNITASYVKNPPPISQSSDLVWYTEEELFQKFNTAIFRGTVTSIKNIKLDFNGVEEYRAIAELMVNEVYRGSLLENQTISILLPCPIETNVWVSDTGVISKLKEGISGIFMPVKYDQTSTIEMNNTSLHLTDLAQYGLLDGERFAFLNTEKGLIFDSYSYPSLSSVITLDEIEAFIRNIIK